MRIAVISDIHGNLTAFEAVLADLRETAPDLVLHGGDLADSGAGAIDVADQIRYLGWSGVYGNTDEMLFDESSLQGFVASVPLSPKLRDAIIEMADWSRERLGANRIDWLRKLAASYLNDEIAWSMRVRKAPGARRGMRRYPRKFRRRSEPSLARS